MTVKGSQPASGCLLRERSGPPAQLVPPKTPAAFLAAEAGRSSRKRSIASVFFLGASRRPRVRRSFLCFVIHRAAPHSPVQGWGVLRPKVVSPRRHKTEQEGDDHWKKCA